MSRFELATTSNEYTLITFFDELCMPRLFVPAHCSLVLFAHALKPQRNAHADVSSEVSLSLGLRLYLHPFFVNTSSGGSGKSAHMRRLA